MYHFMKDDLWGNKVPVMTISGKDLADDFMRRNRHVITQVLDLPRNVSTLIKM